ncbi:hypothetical protein AOLI_G00105070 [Acnodon oligacanthus]
MTQGTCSHHPCLQTLGIKDEVSTAYTALHLHQLYCPGPKGILLSVTNIIIKPSSDEKWQVEDDTECRSADPAWRRGDKEVLALRSGTLLPPSLKIPTGVQQHHLHAPPTLKQDATLFSVITTPLQEDPVEKDKLDNVLHNLAQNAPSYNKVIIFGNF